MHLSLGTTDIDSGNHVCLFMFVFVSLFIYLNKAYIIFDLRTEQNINIHSSAPLQSFSLVGGCPRVLVSSTVKRPNLFTVTQENEGVADHEEA